jgi:hypothetical protein
VALISSAVVGNGVEVEVIFFFLASENQIEGKCDNFVRVHFAIIQHAIMQ